MKNILRFSTNPFVTREERDVHFDLDRRYNEEMYRIAIDEGIAAFLLAIEQKLSGYESIEYFNQKFEEIMGEHNIDLVAHRLYDDHGLKFLDLCIGNNEGEFEDYQICFG